jgi:hypothetical protein
MIDKSANLCPTQGAKSAKKSKFLKIIKKVSDVMKTLKTTEMEIETITITSAAYAGMSFGPLSISQLEEMDVPQENSMSF